jgi:hypothetical protein
MNEDKSGVAAIKDVAFLGFQLRGDKIRVCAKSRTRFKDKIRQLTYRNNPLSMH